MTRQIYIPASKIVTRVALKCEWYRKASNASFFINVKNTTGTKSNYNEHISQIDNRTFSTGADKKLM